MLRYLTRFRKEKRREKNYDAVKPIYDRAKMSLPEDYLAVHQPSDPERVAKIKAAAEARRKQRNEKRLRQS